MTSPPLHMIPQHTPHYTVITQINMILPEVMHFIPSLCAFLIVVDSD